MNREQLEEKTETVKTLLRGCERVLVAFSGGVDSTLLTKLAWDVLGKAHVLAVTADSPSLSRRDLEEARTLAHTLDFQHLVIPTHEVANPAYRANPERRCYFCKHELFVELEALARARGIPVVLYGAIGDDQLTERPGHQAAIARGVRAPLQEAGLAKWEVRELARRLGLPNWDRPQNACLSSRIPHGQVVTEEKLRQVECAEAVLLHLGFHLVRVRHLGAHARIEVSREEVARFQDSRLCEQIMRQFARLGFHSVGVSRTGYQLGGADRHSNDEMPLTVERRKWTVASHTSRFDQHAPSTSHMPL